MMFSTRNMGIKLTGGSWDFVNGANLYGGTAKTTPSNNRTIDLEGVSIRNVGTFYGAYYDTKTTFNFKSGSTLTANRLIGAYGNASSNIAINVQAGSTITVARLSSDGMGTVETVDPLKPGASIRVTGAQAALTVTGSDTTVLGAAFPSNVLSVADGALVILGGKLVLGNSETAKGNRLEVTAGGRLSASITRPGMAEGADGNALRVDNGTFEGGGGGTSDRGSCREPYFTSSLPSSAVR